MGPVTACVVALFVEISGVNPSPGKLQPSFQYHDRLGCIRTSQASPSRCPQASGRAAPVSRSTFTIHPGAFTLEDFWAPSEDESFQLLLRDGYDDYIAVSEDENLGKGDVVKGMTARKGITTALAIKDVPKTGAPFGSH